MCKVDRFMPRLRNAAAMPQEGKGGMIGRLSRHMSSRPGLLECETCQGVFAQPRRPSSTYVLPRYFILMSVAFWPHIAMVVEHNTGTNVDPQSMPLF